MEEQSILDPLIEENIIERKKLLPVWIKVFIWLFMIAGPFILFAFLIGVFTTLHYNSSIYGLESNEPLSPIGLFIFFVFLLKGIVAYGLWTEKDWAVNLGIVDAILGIAACFAVMVVPALKPAPAFTFRLELLLLVPYLVKLLKIREKWMFTQNVSHQP
ncbi:MAG TPA: hypothetical protein VNT20_16905 [Flavisolibacter sp.]|jgi:hypothetical protein|nr:hypothetical protein [Flavisolibacter sp.]